MENNLSLLFPPSLSSVVNHSCHSDENESIFIICVQDYGHRVRLATHSNFKEFVLTSGLEFYPLGGDPKVLAGCMYQRYHYSCHFLNHLHTSYKCWWQIGFHMPLI